MAVNIDEGEPGTFKDRHYLERDPHRFLEGMLVAAAVVGRSTIYIYLRDEYAGCPRHAGPANSPLQVAPCALPPIHLRRGAGAYICGEESAMLESDRGQARPAAATSRPIRCAGRPVRPPDPRSTTSRPCTGCATSSSAARTGWPATAATAARACAAFSVSGRVQQARRASSRRPASPCAS
jgi:hypothetical protein